MPDPADIGNDTAQFCTAEAERRARGKSGPESDPSFDGENCVDCMDAIPSARLKLGKIRCVQCQEILEKQQRMRRH